jgi:hypothetical protein
MSRIELLKRTWDLHTTLRKLSPSSRPKDKFKTLKSRSITLSSAWSSNQGRRSLGSETTNPHLLMGQSDGHKHWSYRLLRLAFCLTIHNCHQQPKRSNSLRIKNSALRGALYSSRQPALKRAFASRSSYNIWVRLAMRMTRSSMRYRRQNGSHRACRRIFKKNLPQRKRWECQTEMKSKLESQWANSSYKLFKSLKKVHCSRESLTFLISPKKPHSSRKSLTNLPSLKKVQSSRKNLKFL